MDAVLNHVNPLTGLAYKDDPTFAGWVDGNNLNLLDGVPPPVVESWISTVSAHYKSIDTKQLYADISLTGGDATITPTVLQIPGVDIYGQEYYPHWFPVAQGGDRVDGTAPTEHALAAETASFGKAFAPLEFGWDNTNFLTPTALQQYLTGIEGDPNIVGDGFWALTIHEDGHGWQPVPADTGCAPTCETLEDGNWWALYYTGVTTLSNDGADMAARGQMLRDHAYLMDGFTQSPAHELVPVASAVTVSAKGAVQWQGSAGAPTYAVQKSTAGSPFVTVEKAAVDLTDYTDATAAVGDCYRVVATNMDGVAAAPSTPACLTAASTTAAAAVTAVQAPSVTGQTPAVSTATRTLASTGLSRLPVVLGLVGLAGAALLRRRSAAPRRG